MFYVYYLRSISHSDQTYIGFTQNLKSRLLAHNSGKCVSSKRFKPWKFIGFLGFDQEEKARKFELHLKSHAGRIFLKRYFNDTIEEATLS